MADNTPSNMPKNAPNKHNELAAMVKIEISAFLKYKSIKKNNTAERLEEEPGS